MLRLRHCGDTWTLTIKLPGREEGGHKIRPEHETRVEDGEVVLLAFRNLGLEIVWKYEKYRTQYELGGVLIALEMIEAVRPHVQGFHLSAPSRRVDVALRVLREAGVSATA